MPESKSPKKVLNADDEHEFHHWQLPDITQDRSQSPSNLFGKFSGSHTPDPVTESSQPMAPPTMAQIEEIRAAAEREGFEQGKQDGYQQGLEQGRLEGLEQGHLEGFTQGEQQGLETGQAKANELGEQLNHIINQFEQPLSILDDEIEAELLAMTLSLAKAVIGHELKTHPEHILSALRQGVDALPLKEQLVKIRLNQTDSEIVNQSFSAEQLQKNQWQIDIDPTLSNGDCMLHSVRSSVDLRVEQRINQVFSELDAQSNQLAKNVKQQKATHPQYQTTSVDNLSEHQHTAELADRDIGKEMDDGVSDMSGTDSSVQHQAIQDDVTETTESVVDKKRDPPSASIDVDQVVAPNTSPDVSDDPVRADKADNIQPPQNDLS
ncbi:flagellar assembly protein FliH [Shewanella polaris]|uniref:Flagellar assembly protein FliH n=1 Tax=Shewanella polaris TaxID=2588449 RepID=A0A4Y5YGK1_9GAMM|nr:flagellar assembly protein FliH [Shewanella polaris]QDE31930.1 flagellar assembly protein FliH [Shewanella polaris]